MFFERVIRFFKGYVVIKVCGKFPERFLNVCACKGILLSDVVYLSKESLKCRMSTKAYSNLASVCEKTAVTTEIIHEGGFPVIRRKYKKRKWLLVGPIIFFAAIFTIVSSISLLKQDRSSIGSATLILLIYLRPFPVKKQEKISPIFSFLRKSCVPQ